MNSLFFTILLFKFGQVFTYGTLVLPLDVDTKADAKSILLAADRDAELLRIFPHRTLFQRKEIAEIYKMMNPQNPLVPDQYVPLGGDPFQDLLFAMTEDVLKVHATFLYAALHSPSPQAFGTLIIEILIYFSEEMELLIGTYNNNPVFQKSLLETVFSSTSGNFQHFLLQLITRRREPEPITWNLDVKEVDRVTRLLIQESRNWENNRETLDYVLMSKSRLFATQVMMHFIMATDGEYILHFINEYIYDENLRFGYKNLVTEIIYPSLRLIEQIHDSEDDPKGQHAINILIIPRYSEYVLYEIDFAFVEKYGQCISQYLLSKNGSDPVNQMLATLAGDLNCIFSKNYTKGEINEIGGDSETSLS